MGSTQYTSINSQYNNTILLIGLKQNSKLHELNAILQCLCHIEPIINYVKYKYDYIKEINSYMIHKKNGKSLAHALKKIIYKLWPDDDFENKKIYTKTEDSNEFLEMIYKIEPKYNAETNPLIKFLQENLHKELNKGANAIHEYCYKIDKSNKKLVLNNYAKNFVKENMSIVSDLFFGTYYRYTQFIYCKHELYDFGFYSFTIYNLFEIKKMKCNMNNLSITSPMILNIHDCLFYDQRVLYNFETCKKCCKSLQCCYKNIIFIPPKILCFTFNKSVPNNTRFLIDEYINIDAYIEVQTNSKYELIGVIYFFYPNRYIAFCKNPINKMWYSYENEKVQQANFNIFQKMFIIPYMLFYQIEE